MSRCHLGRVRPQTEGIVSAAVSRRLSVFVAALFLYVTAHRPADPAGWRWESQRARRADVLYPFVWILSIFDWTWLYSDEFRTIGIVVSVIAVVLAALSLDPGLRDHRGRCRRRRTESWSGTAATASS